MTKGRADDRHALRHLALVILSSLVIGGAFVIVPSSFVIGDSFVIRSVSRTISGWAIWWIVSSMSLSFVAICSSAAQEIRSFALVRSPLIVHKPTAIGSSG